MRASSVISGAVLVVTCVACCFGGAGGSGSGGAVPFLPPQETVLVDETTQVTDNAVQRYTFNLRAPARLNFELDVTSGAGVNAYIMDEADYAQFMSAQGSLFGGRFEHYPALQAVRTTQHRTYGTLAAGSYVLAIQEQSEPNIFGGPDVALVRVRLVATR